MTTITIDRALLAQALEALELVTDLTNHDDEIYGAITALRTALAQEQAEPVQEPVAYRHLHEDGWEYHDAPTGEDCAGCQALFTAPPQREPLTEEEIERIRADEREECAKRLEAIGCDHCAANIRARSKA